LQGSTTMDIDALVIDIKNRCKIATCMARN
jgi:hypothetical protein